MNRTEQNEGIPTYLCGWSEEQGPETLERWSWGWYEKTGGAGMWSSERVRASWLSRGWWQSTVAGQAVAAGLQPGHSEEATLWIPHPAQICLITLTTHSTASTTMEMDTLPPALMKRRKCVDLPTGMNDVILFLCFLFFFFKKTRNTSLKWLDVLFYIVYKMYIKNFFLGTWKGNFHLIQTFIIFIKSPLRNKKQLII